MTSDEVAWAHEGVLWNIGARFIDAHLDDFEATVVDAITEVTRHVDADSAGVWRVDRTTLQCVRQNRWVRQEGLDLGDAAPVTIDREFASRFMEGDGTAIVPLEQVLGAEIVVDRGWTGGSAGLCLVDQSADSITILVLAGLAVQWGEREIDLMRGFATLLRQFAGRVRAERTLGYRLKLEDLVASAAERLMKVGSDNGEQVVGVVLRDVHEALALETTVLVDIVDDSTIEIGHIVIETSLPDVFRRFTVPDISSLPGGEGLTLREFVAEPRILDVVEVVEALVGPELVESMGLSETRPTVALLPASTTAAARSVIAAVRSGDEVEWLPEEFDAMTTIASVIAQARGRVAAEEASAFRLGVQRALAESAAAFLTVDAEGADTAVMEAMARMGQQLGADHAALLVLDEEEHRFVVQAAWTTLVGEIDPADVPVVAASDAWIAPFLAGEAVVGVGRAGEHEHQLAEGMVLDVGSFAAAPVRDEASVLHVIGFAWTEGYPGDEREIGDLVLAIADLIGQLRIRLRAQAEVARRLELDEVLTQIADDFLGAAAADHDVVVGEALSRIGRHLGLAGASVRRIEGDWMIAEAIYSPMDGPPVGERMPFGASGQSEKLLRGDWIELVDPPRAWADSLRDRWGFFGTMVCGPILVGTELRAALSGMRSNDGRWTSIELEVFRSFAAMLGQLRARVEAERRDERQLAAQRVLGECAVELAEARADDLRAATASVVEKVGRFLEIDSLSSWRVDRNNERYVARVGWAADEAVEGADTNRPWDGFGALDESRRTGLRVITEVENPTHPDCSHISIPRGDGDRVDSILLAVSTTPGPWRADAVNLLEALSRTIHQVETRVAAERYADAAFAAAPIGVVLRDAELRLLTCNQAFVDFIGASSVDELIGTFPQEVYDDAFEELDWHDSDGMLTREVAYRRRNGGRVWGQMRGTIIEAAPEGEYLWLVHVEDITDRRRAEQLLRFQASHDELTGLANRRALLDEVRRVADGSGSVAILLLDVDRFKLINDSLGHDRGDELLVVVADRLRLAVRPGDLVARLGGDEFAVVIPGPVTVNEAEFVADRLLELIGDPVTLGSQEVFPTASIGIAVADDGVAVSDLLRRADTAMYRAKAQGRARHEVFDEQLRDEVMARMATEAGLRGALRNGEITVHYQPEVSLITGEVLAVEALVRWEHPQRGLVAAAEFIEIAEETGLVVEIGEQVLSAACREAVEWPGGDEAPLLRVNLAAAQVQRDDTIGVVRTALVESGLPPARLCLEITESAVMSDLDRSGETLDRLKELGVKLAVDDFGTGFSSLAYLKLFPVDVLKIDRAFVAGLGDDSEDTAFVRAILSLAEALDLEVVAEGVETEAQAAALVELGCTRAQGYLFARPVSAGDLRARLTGS